jgi:ATP-dependent RNA helicase DDX55/SPB4
MDLSIGWSDLRPPLDPQIVQTLEETLKMSKVMQVQAAVTPLFLTNKDVCVKACTGSGKTLAFVLPLI